MRTNSKLIRLGLTISLVILFSTSFASSQVTFNGKPTVVVVATGGTIAEASNSTGESVPTLTGKTLINSVPQLARLANIKVVNFSNIDSSHMTPALWLKLSKKVNQILQGRVVKGVVITHGTDTMAEASYFLSLTLKTHKPVVFTGSMRNSSSVSADGAINLLNSVAQICSPYAKDFLVTVNMDDYISSALDVRKINTTNVDAFDAGQKGYLGKIVNGHVILFRKQQASKLILPLPKKLAKVALITTYAGDGGGLIKYAVQSGCKGMVIEALGAGNVGVLAANAIHYALSKHVVVVIASRVANGGVFPLYGDVGGGAWLQKNGAILAHSLSGPKARLLLMLLLSDKTVSGDLKNYKKYF